MEYNDLFGSDEIADYLSGERDHAGLRKIADMIAADPASSDLVAKLQLIKKSLSSPPTDLEAEQMDKGLKVVAARLASEVHKSTEGSINHQSRRRSAWLKGWKMNGSPTALIAVAAMVLLLTIAISGLLTSDAEPMREHITRQGASAVVRLVDGSSVTLGPSSKLSYRTLTNTGERSVYLIGEAFFDVASNPSSPFVVYTSHSATQVLGTRFSVRQYGGDSVARVVVASGRVALRPRSAALGTGITLGKGDLAVIDRNGLSSVSHDVLVESYTGWTSGTLTFNNTSLGAAIGEIERWYDVRIAVSDSSLLSARLNGTLSTGSANEAIERVADVLNLEISRHGQTITLSPRRIK